MNNTEILHKWAELLLDTGKRNNLVSFRDTKATTVEVLLPEAYELFNELEGDSFEVFDPKEDENEDKLSQEKTTDKITFLKELYNDDASKNKGKKKVLIYNASTNPLRVISNIEKKNRSIIEETGVNVAHMAFGFVHWKESNDSHTLFHAPLLLVPIAIEHNSAVDPYLVGSTDDTIMVNPTFSYKLETEQGKKLPEYNDEGLENYLHKVNDIVSNLGWTVTPECKIGLFSFQKINMYMDLKDNAETILQNPNVCLLLDGEDTQEHNEENISTGDGGCRVSNPLVDLHNVVDADASQVEAIIAAKNGQSFVLQGPPGTGKSQTITNILAELMSDNKKVLFVSEKMAALNVVYEQLRNAGLSEFCLELHSHKTNKKSVIGDIYSTLYCPVTEVSSKADEVKKVEASNQNELDKYVLELHKKHAVIEKSLYQLYEVYSAHRKYPDLEWDLNNIQEKGSRYLDEVCSLLDQYVSYVPSIGYDYTKNAWYGYIGKGNPAEAQATHKRGLEALVKMLQTLTPFFKDMSDIEGQPHVTLPELPLLKEFFSFASHSVILRSRILREDDCDTVANQLETLQVLDNGCQELKAELDANFTKEVYNIDGTLYHTELTHRFKGFFSRLFNAEYRTLLRTLRSFLKEKRRMTYSHAASMTQKLETYQCKKSEFAEKEKDVKDFLGSGYNSKHPEWERMKSEIATLMDLWSRVRDKSRFSTIVNYAFANGKFDTYFSILDTALSQCGESVWTSLAHSFNKDVFDILNGPWESTLERCKACLQNINLFVNWYYFCCLIADLKEKEALPFIERVIEKHIEPELVVGSFKRLFYHQWIIQIVSLSPTVSRMNRTSHDQIAKCFCQKDKKQHDINRAKIRAALSASRPSTDMVAKGSPLSIILREGQKRRKLMSIRTLLKATGPLVQNIKPCFLMSPLSVSTFLTPDSVHFDAVVFDEASQVFPQDALGAIYRADQLIVVGDSKQMPPSNFFTATMDNADDYDEEDNEDVSQFESILDKCSIHLQQYRLRWHYRSRYEQLIAFSNKNFYDNTLITFPSCKTDDKGRGIDFYHVDGIFDRKSHTNRKEAEYIVQLIYEHIQTYPQRSLGVVAFSVAQQNLIDQLLYERRCTELGNENFFRKDVKEPFFIKNLESVQGDERDTILFSIAYGKDSSGKLLLNFGPLNKEGGERRLNVAVTRAKHNVQVVSSMTCGDIDLSRSKSEGVKLLREYLDFAENGQGALDRAISVGANDEFDSDFEMEVCEFLRSQGYEVDTQIGCSGYRIDLGLKRPNSSDYLLAIECDGATYHSSKNARDRDRLRQEVLERMGWRFYRIWSTDWFLNKTEEQKLLLDAVKKAVEELNTTKAIATEIPFEDTSYEVAAPQSELTFPKYEAADSEELKQLWWEKKSYAEFVKSVLEKEAPLSEEYFLKRTAWSFNRNKVTSVVRGEFESLMKNCDKCGITRKDGFLYLTDAKVIFRAQGSIERDIKYISPEEIAAGLLQIIRQNGSVAKDALYRALADFCGTRRNGKNVCKHFDAALALLCDEVNIQGDDISLK